MLKLTCSDKKVIDTCYKKFLMNLKELIKINNVHNPLECYKIIISLLKRGKFSVNDEITLNEECDFNEMYSFCYQNYLSSLHTRLIHLKLFCLYHFHFYT